MQLSDRTHCSKNPWDGAPAKTLITSPSVGWRHCAFSLNLFAGFFALPCPTCLSNVPVHESAGTCLIPHVLQCACLRHKYHHVIVM